MTSACPAKATPLLSPCPANSQLVPSPCFDQHIPVTAKATPVSEKIMPGPAQPIKGPAHSQPITSQNQHHALPGTCQTCQSPAQYMLRQRTAHAQLMHRPAITQTSPCPRTAQSMTTTPQPLPSPGHAQPSQWPPQTMASPAPPIPELAQSIVRPAHP
jgi:hypothetical protein